MSDFVNDLNFIKVLSTIAIVILGPLYFMAPAINAWISRND